MRTVSINVMNLCVPCACRCRYCLLSWDGRTQGAEDRRAQAYARRFHDWLKENRPEMSFLYGFGYAMEHPRLMEAIDFCRATGSATGEFLQLNGMAMRTPAELFRLLTEAKGRGVQLINLTFYGTEVYHDRFAGRNGDFRLLLDTLSAAEKARLPAAVDMPLTLESAPLAEALLAAVAPFHPVKTRLFVPHSEGRGRTLEPIRLTLPAFEALPEGVRALMNRRVFRTEAEWLAAGDFPVQEKRVLTLNLTVENIAFFEQQPFEETIAYLEALDDAYYGALPDMAALAARYGDASSDRMYSLRDLQMRYERRYIVENGLDLPDMNDERGHFSRRI